MNKLIVATCFLAVNVSSVRAQNTGSWTISVQQAGATFPYPALATLKKAPFALVFEGAKTWGYGVIAATGCERLEGLKTHDQILEHTNPFAIGAESIERARNTWLSVSTDKALAAKNNSWMLWTEDAESDLYSFQQFSPSAGGKYIGVRKIDSLVIDDDAKQSATVPIEKFAGQQICMLVTGLPPVGRVEHVEPKLVRITFP